MPGEFPIDDSVLFVHPHGGSAWLHAVCSGVVLNGVVLNGVIRIAANGQSFDTLISGDRIQMGNLHPPQFMQTRLDASFKAVKIQVTSLTPWRGLAGDHPYQQSYPR